MSYVEYKIQQRGNSVPNARPCPLPIVRKLDDSYVMESINDVVDFELPGPESTDPDTQWNQVKGEPTINIIDDGRWGRTSDISHQHYPYNACGRLFSTFNGRNYSCSASLIGKKLLMTAGHCVSPGASTEVHENIRFLPNYPKHTQAIEVDRAFIMDGWIAQGAFQYDVAILRLREELPSTGYFAVAVDVPWGAKPQAPYKHHGWWGLSYPAESPFNGQHQISDGGPADYAPFRWGSGHFWNHTYEAQSRNDLTGGSSGGPMLLNPSGTLPKTVILNGYNPEPNWTRLQILNGINSFKYDRWPKTMMTPYFGSTVRNFVQDVISAII
ncbi:MAG: trypsin-like serine protease [Planctomycetota bacterium]